MYNSRLNIFYWFSFLKLGMVFDNFVTYLQSLMLYKEFIESLIEVKKFVSVLFRSNNMCGPLSVVIRNEISKSLCYRLHCYTYYLKFYNKQLYWLIVKEIWIK